MSIIKGVGKTTDCSSPVANLQSVILWSMRRLFYDQVRFMHLTILSRRGRGGGGGGGEGGSRNGGMVIGSALEHKSFPRKPFYDLSFTVCAINAWRVSFLKRHLGAPYKSVDYRSSFCQT